MSHEDPARCDHSGVIKSLDDSASVGYIQSEAFGRDVFFHTQYLSDDYTPKEGDSITFETTISRKGVSAKNIRKKSE